MKHSELTAAILGALVLGSGLPALAANFQQELCVGRFDMVMPGDPLADPVPMWGYAPGGMTPAGTCINTPSSPGPRIVVPDGFDGLDLTLYNTLARPTSVVIPGTVKPMAPVFFTPAGETIPRVRSFDAEAAANGGSVSYSWNNLPPGSYMYQSGTHQQVQVQMGLFGALTRDAVAGAEAYPGKPYSQDIVLFYSEVDRQLHVNADQGMYTETDMKSTIDYAPKYFLVDVDTGSQVISSSYDDLLTINLPPNLNPLLRFYNAGQRIHIPMLYEAEFDIIAEDGKPYPSSKQQYTIELPPLKVRDAYLNITGNLGTTGGSFRMIDSAMALSNPAGGNTGAATALAATSEIANGRDNGMVLRFSIAADPAYVPPRFDGNEPRARRDELTVPEGGSLNNIVALITSNDLNAAGARVDILTHPRKGVLADNGQGDFSYRHDGSEQARDSLIYSLTNADGESSTSGVIINVVPVNDPPVAENDRIRVRVGQKVEIRALANDSDVDSPRISIVRAGSSSLGLISAREQVILFEALSEGQEDIDYVIQDDAGATASAMISITVEAALNAGSDTYTQGSSGNTGPDTPAGEKPVTVADSYTVVEGGVLDLTGNPILGVLANDSPGAKVYTGLAEYPEHGSIQIFEDGTFIYTHNGDDEDDDRFVYEAWNENGSTTGEVLIRIEAKQNPPKVNNDKVKTRSGVAVLIDILKNDRDKDSDLDPAGIVISRQPQHGILEMTADGRVRYIPDAGFSGKDSFRYQLRDSVTGELSHRAAKVKVKVR